MSKRQIILYLLHLLIILIFIDLVATLGWVLSGLASESNPLMRYFLSFSPLLFVMVKLSLSFVGVYILYIFRKRFRKMIFYSCLGLTFVYMLVALHHIKGITLLFH